MWPIASELDSAGLRLSKYKQWMNRYGIFYSPWVFQSKNIDGGSITLSGSVRPCHKASAS